MLCLFIRQAGVHYVVLYGSTTSDTFGEGTTEKNVLSFFQHDIKHGIAQLHSFSVISFIPVFISGRYVKDEIVSAKNLSKRAGPNTVHTAWFKIHQYRSKDVLSSHNFIKTHIDALQFQIRIAFIDSSKPVMANDDSSTRR